MTTLHRPARSPEDCVELLAEGRRHWKTGHSAKALLTCWFEAKGLPRGVARVLNNSGIAALKDVEILIAIPEHQVPLPPKGGHPSQNDLWILGRSGQQLVSMTVEGKVGESFGETLGEWSHRASAGKKQRLAFLTDILGLSQPLPQDIRYQLLHRTASAIIEAKRFGAGHALMLVHSFSPSDQGLADYQGFTSLFGVKAAGNQVVEAGTKSGVALYLGWVRGESRYLRA